jgi:hypothetical protein
LFGSSKGTLSLDVAVSRSGPYIDPTSHASLLAPVTCDVIKQALFNIDDNKASRLDGYTFLFFKKSWDIVGSDFCHAVCDFFVSENFSSRLITPSLLSFLNLPILLRLLTSYLFLVVMWCTK